MAAPEPTPISHRDQVDRLLRDARAEHLLLLARRPPEIARSLPVDAQGIQHAIDHLAEAAGLSSEERRRLIRHHAVNPAVLHARVFGGEGLTDATILGAFVDGARVRADALTQLADEIGGDPLVSRVRTLLADAPPPAEPGPNAEAALVATYEAQEQAAHILAAGLDARA